MEDPLIASSGSGPASSSSALRRWAAGLAALLAAACAGAAFLAVQSGPPPDQLTAQPGMRMFLHVADTHADPFYDYTQYMVPAPKVSRSPRLYSNKVPADECAYETEGLIFEYWNKTGGGPSCPCGHYGANPPFSVLVSLGQEIERQRPEFVVWSGDFASHYEPGTSANDSCRTARSAAKATVSVLNAQTTYRVQHLWAWGNNDVLPKRRPLTQGWLEEFGAHLLEAGWLREEEMATWNRGGFYRRNVGKGLCVVSLNSNSWTENQVNEVHHAAQVKWFAEEAFSSDPSCKQYLLNAHVPLGWLESGSGHHQWNNLQGAEVTERSEEYRKVIDKHHKSIIAELYGHINKADIRLMDGKHSPEEDDIDGHPDMVGDSSDADALGDLTEDIGGLTETVSFTVAGISRRGLNDPQFQRIYLEGAETKYTIFDIDVLAMKKQCDFEFSYSFRELFKPHFDSGINTATLRTMVSDKRMVEKVESHLSLSASPYTKADLKNPAFMEAVRNGTKGCEVR